MRAPNVLLVAALAGGVAAAAAAALAPFDTPAWRFVSLPNKVPTRFDVVVQDGAPALRIEADASYGNLVHDLLPPAPARPLAWQWRVEQRNEASDLRQRRGDDTTLKVCALFDMAIDRVPFAERQLLRVGRMTTGEALPAASVCYVWDAKLAQGTTLDNAFSRRIRYVVARGPDASLGRWLDERHDLVADFQRLFGDESTDVPPLTAIAVGADADNTRARSVGFVRGLRWAAPS